MNVFVFQNLKEISGKVFVDSEPEVSPPEVSLLQNLRCWIQPFIYTCTLQAVLLCSVVHACDWSDSDFNYM